jgi:hypothetical protein
LTSHGRKYGEKESRPIPVWNGVLEHCSRIACAIWVFLWCIDKVTEEREGSGIVFGGAPVKMSKIAADLEIGEHSVRRHFDQLEHERYIRRRRTPYGFVIEVLNSRKFEIWHSRENVKSGRSLPRESVQERPVSPTPLASLTDENGRNKEDAAVDSAIDAAGQAATSWRAIGTDKLGTPRFRSRWEFLFAHRNGNPISDAMERCIVSCQESGIPVPKPFYDAKRRVEATEKDEDASRDHERKGRLDYLPSMPPLPCKS